MTALALSRRSLAEALPDFAVAQRTALRPAVEQQAAQPAPAFVPSGPSEEDIRARIEAAAAAASADAERRLKAEHEAALAALRDEHAAELARLDAAYGGALGTALKEGLDAVEARVTELTVSVAARLLGVALTEDIRRRAVDQLARCIDQAMGDSEAVTVTVRGPMSLHDALVEALGSRAGQLRFVEDSGPDLTATVDDVHFETRIAAWSDAISGAVA